MKIGNREFQTERHTYVMGILNVTPDSFSDGGKWNEKDKALFRVEEMIREGIDILDIGGESTRPGYTQLADEEEIARVTPIIEAVKAHFDVPVSLDTYKSEVAACGLQAGADMINDIWGLKYDTRMASIIAEKKVPCCLMHNRREAVYQNFMQDVAADLTESVRLAKEAGVCDEHIILDPGVGFAKSYEQNLEVMGSMEQLRKLGYPMLLGCSRKSVIGLTLDLPSDQRLEGTLATSVLAVVKGYSFVRVHDVKENVRAIKMAEAILYGG